MPLVKLSSNERRRLSVFFTCLILAGIAWVLTTLSTPYNFKLKEVLVYKNTPQKRAFHSLQSDTVNVTVKGTAWQMLFSGMSDANKQIPIDAGALETKNFIVLSTQVKQINDKKVLNQDIISFNPDTLYFDFSNRATKKVPVQLITKISYRRQFAQSDDITIRPAYVILNGPANVLEKIKSWKTDSFKVDSANETIGSRISLQAVREGNVNIYPRMVQVSIPVDEFTEKTIEVPVRVINNRDYYNIKIFPQKVKITFTVSLSKYNDTDDAFFEAVVDLELWREHNYSALPVKLTRLPAYCRVVKIQPQNIDFIIKK